MLRERRGLSREEFSERFGVANLAKLELGRREPRLSDILALCDSMKVTPNVLLRGLYRQARKPRRRQPARVHGRDQAQAQARAAAPAKRAS